MTKLEHYISVKDFPAPVLNRHMAMEGYWLIKIKHPDSRRKEEDRNPQVKPPG